MRKTIVLLVVAVVAGAAVGFQAAKFGPVNPDPKGMRPIEAVDTVFIEDMTWMEVRDAMAAGKDTVIVATGGIEQNGPYLAANKHNVVLRGTTDAIARKLGNALVAPIIGFVPEGDIDPPTVHMNYPSTVSLTEDTYRRLLVDVCSCYRTHGFKHVVMIGDSGGNQDGMKAVAAELNAKWKDGKTKFDFIPEYYNYGNLSKWLEERGIQQKDEGLHDDFAMEAMMLSIDPSSVRMKQRVAAGKFKINGVELAPVEKTVALGKQLIDYRAEIAVAAIRKSIGGSK
jgi:creatinine amidohydrolase/Fe(II)-dependent formamide hydrolase-like protein